MALNATRKSGFSEIGPHFGCKIKTYTIMSQAMAWATNKRSITYEDMQEKMRDSLNKGL